MTTKIIIEFDERKVRLFIEKEMIWGSEFAELEETDLVPYVLGSIQGMLLRMLTREAAIKTEITQAKAIIRAMKEKGEV